MSKRHSSSNYLIVQSIRTTKDVDEILKAVEVNLYYLIAKATNRLNLVITTNKKPQITYQRGRNKLKRALRAVRNGVKRK